MKIQHPNGKDGYYMEDDLYENLKVLPKRIEKDKDVCAAFVGSPGEGKSTLSQQVLYFLDPSIDIGSVMWSYDDYVRYCDKLFQAGKSKGKGVIYDESKETLSNMSIMSRKTRGFMNFLYENRQMNMYQFLLTGDFFDLPRTIVMQRLLFVIWVHEEGEFENGFFKFYNRESLKRLYLYGHKERNMSASGYNFRGRFSKFYTVDEDKYRQQKKAFLSVDRFLDQGNQNKFTIKDIVFWSLERNPELDVVSFSHNLKCDPSTIYGYIKEWKLEKGANNI